MDCWYALYTKPRHEDSASVLLQTAGIETLSPKLRLKKFAGFRPLETVEPLFPCYIFARFDPMHHSRMVKYTRGVRYIVGRKHPIKVAEEIIRAIQEKMESGAVRLEPERFGKGDHVYVRTGAFEGFYGIFERYTKGSERALILLRTINFNLDVESWTISGLEAGRLCLTAQK